MAEGPPTAAPPRRDELPPPGTRAHLVGAGGAGMRGLAVLLHEEDYRVSGCDRSGEVPPELAARGIEVREGHDPSHVEGVELVVHSSAIPEESPELAAARSGGARVLKRARALGALLDSRRVAGIAGTHGKTTITAMAGLACEAAGLDPAVAVGGVVPAWGGCARPGRGRTAVVEADEFDASFLQLDPWLAVVSSLEPEHLESYGSMEALREAFAAFAGRAAPRGGVLYCLDDPGARGLCEGTEGARSYGLAAPADFRVEAEGGEDGRQRCRLRGPDVDVRFALAVPGRHNAQNAAGALAAALALGADPERAAGGLEEFRGAERRLQLLADGERVTVVDDYAHHPTEVRASLAALRGRWPGRRLVAVFQPHLYSRTRAFAAEFAAALAAADRALVLPVYGAREEPIPGVDAALVVAAGEGLEEASRADALAAVREAAGDPAASVFAFMGAGDVTALAHEAAAEVAGHAVGA